MRPGFRFFVPGMPAGIKELVKLPAGSAFRVLTWEQNLREVFWVVSGDRRQRINATEVTRFNV